MEKTKPKSKPKPNPRAKKERVTYANYYGEFVDRVMAKVTGVWVPSVAATKASGLPHVVLYYTEPSENSDKEYQVRISYAETKTWYDVYFAYGKRGKIGEFKLKAGYLSLPDAKRLFNSMTEEKIKNGYTTNISGKPFTISMWKSK